MGCDIHACYEFRKSKIQHIGRWKHAGEGPVNRDYTLFGILAGVRSKGTPLIDLPRGIPGDVNQQFRSYIEAWGCDGHSHSYVTLRELIEFRDKWRGCSSELTPIITAMKRILKNKGLEDPDAVRLVFFFDN